jgi:hypothetical protein
MTWRLVWTVNVRGYAFTVDAVSGKTLDAVRTAINFPRRD